MDIRSLKRELRSDFNNYIRDLVIKNKCENCESSEKLIVHHSTPFVTLLNETLIELGLKDNKYFNEEEVKIIRNIMLGKQIRNKSVTLCDKCHKEFHKLYPVDTIFKIVNDKEEEKVIELDLNWKNTLDEFIDKTLDMRLYKEHRNILIRICNVKDDHGRRQRSISNIRSYIESNTDYTITSKRV